MILAERAARIAAEAEAETAKATRRVLDIEIERLKLEIARLRRERFGPSAERSARLKQLELSLEDLEETAAAADAVKAADAGETTEVRGFPRRKPARRPLPEHLPRTRVVYPGPTACPCCGGGVRKLGEVVTESLERVPARWFVVQHVREKVSCRSCEAITEAPAPFHPIARGRAGPNLLAEVVFAKYGLHLPLHRQSDRFAREGVPIEVSTLADWVGAVSVSLKPLVEAIKAHVLAGTRIHADDTPVPVLAKGKTRTGRLWTVVRDDRPFGGHDPPAAAYFYSADRRGAHAQAFLKGYSGVLQADAFLGFGRLYEPGRAAGPITEAACRVGGDVAIPAPQSGRIEARTGLRMMPTFPRSPLSFRTAGFPQYGWKAGLSGGAFPDRQRLKPAPGIRLLTAGLPSPFVHRSIKAVAPYCAGPLTMMMHRLGGWVALRPRGPRSGPGYAVPVRPRLTGPIRPTRRHIATSPQGGLSAMPSLCGSAEATREWFRAFATIPS